MEKQYKPNEFAKLLNVSVKTLQRWDNDGVLKAFRSPKDRRYYKHSQYLDYVGESSNEEEIERKVINRSDVANKSKWEELISLCNDGKIKSIVITPDLALKLLKDDSELC